MHLINPLTGDWRLSDWSSVADDGSSVQPMGPAPSGILVYSADGTMITTIAPSVRPPRCGIAASRTSGCT